MSDVARNEERKYITFMANGQEFASDILMIREIRGWTDITPLPHVPDYVRGLINLRGSILPVIDLKARLGLGLTEATDKHVIIVAHNEVRTTGILVDAVSDIIVLSPSDTQPTPDLADGGNDKCIHGIAVVDGRLVTVLNTTGLIDEAA
ncbi:MAG: chemotaxis protein CheW [Rhizomicrobium sp.]|nr:chemotaxis protein CheW [Rhizomicrobium sp.]